MSQSTETPGPIEPMRSAARPTARQWALHVALFLVTAVTTTISGIVWTADFGPYTSNERSAGTSASGGSLWMYPWLYLRGVAAFAWRGVTHPALRAAGLAA